MTPYSTTPHRYPFPALAAQAGRGRIGGTREIALACLMAAHLASDARTACTRLDDAARAERVASARGWFAALTVPATLRAACERVIDAAARTAYADLAPALAAVSGAARRHLDRDSVAELERVVETLRT